MSKLEFYDIKDKTLSLFKSYLSQRQQLVSIDNTKPRFRPITFGVPQGSILGPLLFFLFINDLPLYTSNVSTDMYADDTKLYDVQTSQDTIEKNLQIALKELHKWCKNNGMVLNSTKTKVMLITTNQKRHGFDRDGPSLNFNVEPLQVIVNDKLLGVFVDNNLTWNKHIKHISKKIASNIWSLSKMKDYLSQEHPIQFYKSYIQPHIDFCNIIWGNTSESNKQKILRMQKRAVRVILYYNVENSHKAMKSLNIQSVYDRLFLRKAKFMFKVYIILRPHIQSTLFLMTMFVPSYL